MATDAHSVAKAVEMVEISAWSVGECVEWVHTLDLILVPARDLTTKNKKRRVPVGDLLMISAWFLVLVGDLEKDLTLVLDLLRISLEEFSLHPGHY